ncbi:hypothetical protein GCM10009815_21830 [Nocardioides marmoribigeumensis]
MLGTTGVTGDDGQPVDIPARKRRAILAALVLRREGASADGLLDLVWGESSQRAGHGSLHSYVSGLRRALEPGLGPRQRPTTLLTTDQGYRLALPPEAVDALVFADVVRSRHRVLGPLAGQLTGGDQAGWPSRAEVSAHVEALEQALASWSGEPYADLPDHPDVLAERAALEELRLTAEEDRVLGLLALGDHATVVAATEQATARHPLRERLWALHALALTRAGRQGDALAALRQARTHLADELGLDPGQELRDLEQAVLQQDPALHRWLRGSPSPPRPADRAAERLDRTRPVPRARVPWETVGRAAEERALTGLLEQAAGGDLALGTLVGEPGIGKSRLVEQVVAEARAMGFAVGVGRCSQDDGAPPLWPWRAVLRAIAEQRAEEPPRVSLDTDAEDPERAAFDAWESLATVVRRWAAEQPVLVVLEDLHWADRATLRALAHLVATQDDGVALAVLATRRPFPPPEGTSGDVEELLTRRHATRLDLGGLTREESRALVAHVADQPVPDAQVDNWHERSGGNPFFLVELARTRAGELVPSTLRELLLRRLHPLPDGTADLLRQAAVAGREFSLEVVAAAAGADPDAVDRALDDARALGLVRDREVGRLAFDHALTRDALVGALPPVRRARLHARVAHALETDADLALVVPEQERVSELASHWLAAGPTHAARAWRAAVAAAELARRAFSHEEAMTLMGQAVEAHRRDPAGTRVERFDLLMSRARDAQRLGDWKVVIEAASEAVSLARLDRDLPRLARAAAALSHLTLWSVRQWHEVDEDVVEDLRWALAEVGDADSADRCRLLGALAIELYYLPGAIAERQALAHATVDLAERLGDPALRWWALRAAYIALWFPSTVEDRLRWAHGSLAAAREWGDADAEALSTAAVAGTALELGDLETFGTYRDLAWAQARRRRLSYVIIAMSFIDLCVAVISGDARSAAVAIEELRRLRSWVEVPGQDMHEFGTGLIAGFWSGEVDEGVLQMALAAAAMPGGDIMRGSLLHLLARLERPELPGFLAEIDGYAPEPATWSSPADDAADAELAAALGDLDRARRAREALRPLEGRMVVAGISLMYGPVDGYLALLEALLGETERAAGLADRALAVASAQGWDLYVAWLEGYRQRLGF